MVEFFNDHWYKVDLLEEGLAKTHWIPSVTTKLNIIGKPFLTKWRGDVGNREADLKMFEAGQRGKRIHHAWHVFCTSGTVVYNPWEHPNYTEAEIAELKKSHPLMTILQYQDEMLDLIKLQRLVKELKPKMIESEKVVYCLETNDAGTVDNIWDIEAGSYFINGSKPLTVEAGRYIVDLKTGSVVDDNAYLQIASYAHCVSSMKQLEGNYADSNIQGTLILHTGSSNKSGIEGFSAKLRNNAEKNKDYEDYRLAAKLWERKHSGDTPKVFEFPSLIKLGE